MSEGGCTRRRFLHRAGGGCFVAALTALGLPHEVWALPIGTIAGSGTGTERRYAIPSGDSVNIDRDTQVILVRWQNHVFAFALSCPHQNAAVKWVERDRRFQCTRHDSKYQPDGVYMSGRATRNLDRFPLRRDGSDVVVELDRVFQSDKDPAGWAAAVIDVSSEDTTNASE